MEEWDPKTASYTGRCIKKTAGYIIKSDLNTFGQRHLIEKHGLYVITLE